MDDVQDLKTLLEQFGYEKIETEFGPRYEKVKWPTVIFNYSNNSIVVRSLTQIRMRVRFPYAGEIIDYILQIASRKKK